MIYLLLIFFILMGCSDPIEEIRTINVDIDNELQETVSIFDIFSKVELIELDDSHPVSNSVFSGEAFITMDSSYIYILDEYHYNVHVFDQQGHSVLFANKVGRGKGEYTMGYQIHYNSDIGMVEILNPMGKILQYSPITMEYKSELNRMGKGLMAMHEYHQFGDEYIILSKSIGDRFWLTGSSDDSIKSFGYIVPEEYGNYILPTYSFFELNGKPCAFRSYDGQIYVFDTTDYRMIPIISWNFGKYNCTLSDIPENKNTREYNEVILANSKGRVSPFLNIKACNDVLYVSLIFNGQIYPHTLYYDLKTGECSFFERTSEGMRFLPELFVDNVMYKFVDCAHLPEYINRNILDSDSQKHYDSILTGNGMGIIKYHL